MSLSRISESLRKSATRYCLKSEPPDTDARSARAFITSQRDSARHPAARRAYEIRVGVLCCLWHDM
jgi:hypothetical protein